MNEIFKGMDNAAEKIDDNFKQVEITSGNNENGQWVILPDGTKSCRMEATYDKSTTGIYVNFPIEFTEVPSVTISAATHDFDSVQDIAMLGYGADLEKVRIQKHTLIGDFRSNSDIPLIIRATGK